MHRTAEGTFRSAALEKLSLTESPMLPKPEQLEYFLAMDIQETFGLTTLVSCPHSCPDSLFNSAVPEPLVRAKAGTCRTPGARWGCSDPVQGVRARAGGQRCLQRTEVLLGGGHPHGRTAWHGVPGLSGLKRASRGVSGVHGAGSPSPLRTVRACLRKGTGVRAQQPEGDTRVEGAWHGRWSPGWGRGGGTAGAEMSTHCAPGTFPVVSRVSNVQMRNPHNIYIKRIAVTYIP